jgi:hypothetical protein
MSKQSTTDRKIAAAQSAARDQEFFARCSHTLYRFMKAHANDPEGGISPCAANMALIDAYIDGALLDASDPQAYEICLLALGHRLVRVKNPEIPKPPASPAAPTPVQSEDECLRAILRENRGNPKAAANAARAMLKTKDVHAKQTAQALPAEITKEDIIRMSPDRQRYLTSRYGSAALNNRLKGIN